MNRHLVVLALLLAGFEALAAQETTGAIRGRLVASGVGPVVGAQVTATSPDLLGVRRSVSAGDGMFTLPTLPPGTYTLRVAAIGYRPVAIEGVVVQLGRVTGLASLPLEPAAVTLAELTIAAPPVTLDPVRTTIGATLEAADFAMLPADRDHRSLLALLPHINTSYHGDAPNSGGSTGLENVYFIDGVNVTDMNTGKGGTTLPYNFVRSVEVRSGGYEARYGRALGAIVNAVTYTGTNQHESHVFAFMTHDALTLAPKGPPVLRESGAYGFDVGARISGPVARDRLWYSAAYNPRVDQVDREIGALGKFPDTRTAHLFAGKLTWQARPTVTVEMSVFGDPTTHERVSIIGPLVGYQPVNPDPYLSRARTGGVTGAAKVIAALGSAGLLEAAVQHAAIRDDQVPRTPAGAAGPLLQDLVEQTIEGGVPFTQRNAGKRTALSLQVTRIRGRHTMVVGAEYEDNRNAGFFENPGGFMVRIAPTTYQVITQRTDGTVGSRIPTVYVQDAWRAAERLTVSAGLRWSSQTVRGSSGRTAQRFPNEWQPRAGVSWLPGRDTRERLFASYGRFYQQGVLNLPGLYFVDFHGGITTHEGDPRQPGAVRTDSVDWTATEATARDQVGLQDGLAVEHFDEYTVGYERVLGSTSRLTVRAMRRDLRSSYQQVIAPDGRFLLGTPGHGELAFMPAPVRNYTALEATVDGAFRGWRYRASYVLSRAYGNYTGLYSSDEAVNNPGVNVGFSAWYQAANSKGLLPNDRTHVFKLAGSSSLFAALTAGGILTIMSGTPVSEFGGGPAFFPAFLSPRGTAGRTRPVWDLNLRATYDLRITPGSRGRLVLDLLHVGSPRAAVRKDQFHFRSLDDAGNQANWNRDYLRPTAFQPPMMARLGVEVGF